ncbi:MAG: DJ-1/PfpI family protein [candidate division Zixibacteria bacterium]|nr:DJ-1/PfpI family protein [candidate division Zixibacteria bacterium]
MVDPGFAHVLLLDGYADWEAALALCEINEQGKHEVAPVGLSKNPVTSMGGLKVTPDVELSQVDPSRTAIFIMPGAAIYKDARGMKAVEELLVRLHTAGAAIAAICAAVLPVARAGLLNSTKHTANSLEFLKSSVPEYAAEDFFIEAKAVRDGGIITAGGADYVEFTVEIIRELGIYDDTVAKEWYNLFKHGIIPDEHH